MTRAIIAQIDVPRPSRTNGHTVHDYKVAVTRIMNEVLGDEFTVNLTIRVVSPTDDPSVLLYFCRDNGGNVVFDERCRLEMVLKLWLLLDKMQHKHGPQVHDCTDTGHIGCDHHHSPFMEAVRHVQALDPSTWGALPQET